MTLRTESVLKKYQLNVQSILSKKEQLRTLVHDLGLNCIFFVSQKNGCEFDDKKVFKPCQKRYCCFRTDRISTAETKMKKFDGVMMLVPKVFSRKIRNDFILFTGKFESVWVSLKIPTCPPLLVNVTYNPIKQNTLNFWDQLVINIDNAITKNKMRTLMGGYNISYLDTLEKSRFETVLLPYDLHIENQTIPSR